MPNLNLQEEESVVKEMLKLYKDKLRLTYMPPLIIEPEDWKPGEIKNFPGTVLKFSWWQRLKWKLGIGISKIK